MTGVGLVAVGGGYIAVEFAQIFHGYGSKVSLVYRGDNWLRGFDDDLRTHLKTEYDTAVGRDEACKLGVQESVWAYLAGKVCRVAARHLRVPGGVHGARILLS